MTRTVPVGEDYQVSIGHDPLAENPALLLTPLAGAQQVLLLHAGGVVEQRAQDVAETMRRNGLSVHTRQLPDAEEAKTADVLQDCWCQLGRAAFGRTDAVVAVGGGAVTDVAGFAAATWLRGIRVVHLPTTLLAMVDAAVGGKTAINTAEGKNLVGAFHSPAAVICDLNALSTLPRADLIAGAAEVIKTGFIADPVILDLIERDPIAALDPAGPVLAELVERSVRVKADVVTQDFTESSLREILNYGHTFGHAIEQVEHYRWRHGDAVSVGMVYAAELGSLTGHTDPALVQRHREVLAAVGLPLSYEPGNWDDLLTVMGRDKKTRGGTLRFVVLNEVAAPTRLEGPPRELLEQAYGRIVTARR